MDNRRIVNYNLIASADGFELGQHVRDVLDLGWQPFGAPFNADGIIIQAMVKYEEAPARTVPL